MQKLLLLNICLALVVSLGAQTLSITPNPVHTEGLASTNVIQSHVVITNESNEELNLLWQRWIISSPQGWQVQICDQRLCYLPSVDRCPDAYPNTLMPGESMEMRVDILPSGVVGEGTIHVDLFDISDTTNILATVEANFTLTTTSVDDPGQDSDIRLYPNPATEYFRIQNPEAVSMVQLYNIVGNRLMTQPVFGDDKISIGGLPNGMYLVRLFGNDNRVLKTIRLSKR